MNLKLMMEAQKLADRPYTIEIARDETTDGDLIFVARIEELQGCIGQGDTIEEAETNVKEAMIDFIYSLLEDKLAVPEPKVFETTTFSVGTPTIKVYRYDADRNVTYIVNPNTSDIPSDESKHLYSASWQLTPTPVS